MGESGAYGIKNLRASTEKFEGVLVPVQRIKTGYAGDYSLVVGMEKWNSREPWSSGMQSSLGTIG